MWPVYLYFHFTVRKRSCGKVMFYTCLSVILFMGGGGVCPSACWDTHPLPPGTRDTPKNQRQTPPRTRGRHPAGQTPPPPWADPPSRHPSQADTPPADTPGQTPPRADTPHQMAAAADGTHPSGMHTCLSNTFTSNANRNRGRKHHSRIQMNVNEQNVDFISQFLWRYLDSWFLSLSMWNVPLTPSQFSGILLIVSQKCLLSHYYPLMVLFAVILSSRIV